MTALRPPTRAGQGRGHRHLGLRARTPAPSPGPVDPAPAGGPRRASRRRCPAIRAATGAPRPRSSTRRRTSGSATRSCSPTASARGSYAVGIDVNMAFARRRQPADRRPAAPPSTSRPRSSTQDPRAAGSPTCPTSNSTRACPAPSPRTAPGPTGPPGTRPPPSPTPRNSATTSARSRPTAPRERPVPGRLVHPAARRLPGRHGRPRRHPDLDEADFLAAMEQPQGADPAPRPPCSPRSRPPSRAASASSANAPRAPRYRPGERWPALERPTWRPDIRAAVISAARVNMHRKMLKLADGAGLFPSPCCPTAPSTSPTAPARSTSCPARPTASRCPGGFRLGVSPGMVKHEGTQSLMWAVTDARRRPQPRPAHQGRRRRRTTESRDPVGIFGDGLDEGRPPTTFTRPVPKSARRADAVPGQAAQGHQGRRRNCLGISQRTVERYLKARSSSPATGPRRPPAGRGAQPLAAPGARAGHEAGRHAPGHRHRDPRPVRLHRRPRHHRRRPYPPDHPAPAARLRRPPLRRPGRRGERSAAPGTSPPKDCRRSTSRTAAAGPTACWWNSPTSTTSRWTSRASVPPAVMPPGGDSALHLACE